MFTRNCIANECGATIVEFAIGGVLTFMLIMGAIDFGMGIYRYVSLTYVVTELTPWYARATNVVGGGNCDAVANAVMEQRSPERYLSEVFGGAPHGVSFRPRVSYRSATNRLPDSYTYHLEASWDLGCFFCIVFGGLQVQAESKAHIENRLFRCGIDS